MKNKHVGVLVIGITIVFFLIVMSFNSALETIVNTTCTHGTSCPMQVTLKTQKIISYSLMGLVAAAGIFITFFLKDENKKVMTEVIDEPSNTGNNNSNNGLTEEQKQQKLQNLDDDEVPIMNIILREQGSVYQSDIIKETKLTKVKVTRILDKLEGRGLIERKRRGMTNIIILK